MRIVAWKENKKNLCTEKRGHLENVGDCGGQSTRSAPKKRCYEEDIVVACCNKWHIWFSIGPASTHWRSCKNENKIKLGLTATWS